MVAMNKLLLAPASLVGITIFSGAILLSPLVSADSTETTTTINVPESCTMAGTNNTAHTADLINGTYSGIDYTNGIGLTTLKVFCNDSAGYAIYAIGYTNDEYGNTRLHFREATSISDTTNDINTGIYTQGTTVNSTWSMKLASLSGTYVTTITDGTDDTEDFTNWHEIPDEYTKVAYKTSGTDMPVDQSGTGSSITTTYDAYISTTQPAGAYMGQVKYILIHPSSAAEPVPPDYVGVNYYANDLSFPDGKTKNRVVYMRVPESTYATFGDEFEISKTSNINDNGVVESSMLNYTNESDVVEIQGADVLKVVVSYKTAQESPENGCQAYFYFGGKDFMDSSFGDFNLAHNFTCDEEGQEEIYYLDGDSAYFFFDAFLINYDNEGEEIADNEYGYYAKVYPGYYANEDDEGAQVYETHYTLVTTNGEYAETTTWNDDWFGETLDPNWLDYYAIWSDQEPNPLVLLQDEDAIKEHILLYWDSIAGSTWDLYSLNPHTVKFEGNNASGGTMTGFTTSILTDTPYSKGILLAPNFYKSNNGFAGWSANPNATANGSDRIYGPNERVAGDYFVYDSNHETTLYAIWVPSSGNLQNWSGCPSLNEGKVIALKDTRDNNVYTVSKLADGKCWMLENLRLDDSATLDSSNTHNPNSSFTSLPATSSWCWGSNATCINNSKYSSNNTNIGGVNDSGVTLTPSPTADARTSYWYGYGNYYNWYSATAGTGSFSMSSPSGDLCPAGWKLPTGYNNGDFSVLDSALGGTGHIHTGDGAEKEFLKYPNNFVRAGEFGAHQESSSGRGYIGEYWTATVRGTDRVYALEISNSSLTPGFTANTMKYNGYPIRCVKE